jgi:hypothetical protein
MLGIIIGDQPNHIVNLNNIKIVLTKVKNRDSLIEEIDIDEINDSLKWVDDLIETYNYLDSAPHEEQ